MQASVTEARPRKPVVRPRYTDVFRASCVLMAEAAGYPGNVGALALVARKNRVPERTLSRWVRGESNPPSDLNVTQQRRALTDILADMAHTYAAHTLEPSLVADTSARDSAVVMGIAVDKARLLMELSTEATTALREYQAAASMAGVDGLDMLRRMTARLNAQAEANEHAQTAMIMAPTAADE